ncbi:hypothetical protein KUCAC02_012885 [Chaenocephalus aceratus]|uniref:Uncharacterized protein n=1 Tax=Chaenocephalus aceratus TaxID=36190 RepID=A0ACB9XD32_CHAAC|nr:hypothetical protein KUCAC02_012885 [Chaenocephalus aceratus]
MRQRPSQQVHEPTQRHGGEAALGLPGKIFACLSVLFVTITAVKPVHQHHARHEEGRRRQKQSVALKV